MNRLHVYASLFDKADIFGFKPSIGAFEVFNVALEAVHVRHRLPFLLIKGFYPCLEGLDLATVALQTFFSSFLTRQLIIKSLFQGV